MVQLAVGHPDRVKAAMEPLSRLLLDLVRDAQRGDLIAAGDPHHASALVQQTVMYSWFGNRLIQNPRQRLGADETWEFCLRGLGGQP